MIPFSLLKKTERETGREGWRYRQRERERHTHTQTHRENERGIHR